MPAVPPGRVDPVTRWDQITVDDKVATIGSCFAQHLSRKISDLGLNYYVTEPGPDALSASERLRRNYGVFSARYGNVYTVRQCVQLLDRAFGEFSPSEIAWEHPSGGFVDPFRPQINLGAFQSTTDLQIDRESHLRAVRELCTNCDWLVFTLGLTEAWRSKQDGSVFPIAPGVAGGHFDTDRHEFVNFGIDDVRADLNDFITKLRSVNPAVKILLTVSPVALAATFERRHVLESTVLSKSVLRVAADEAQRKFVGVIYFPSFEIITSAAAGGRYYADDLRQVTKLGVDHVMRVFEERFIQGASAIQGVNRRIGTIPESEDVICDEEIIENALLRGQQAVAGDGPLALPQTVSAPVRASRDGWWARWRARKNGSSDIR